MRERECETRQRFATPADRRPCRMRKHAIRAVCRSAGRASPREPRHPRAADRAATSYPRSAARHARRCDLAHRRRGDRVGRSRSARPDETSSSKIAAVRDPDSRRGGTISTSDSKPSSRRGGSYSRRQRNARRCEYAGRSLALRELSGSSSRPCIARIRATALACASSSGVATRMQRTIAPCLRATSITPLAMPGSDTYCRRRCAGCRLQLSIDRAREIEQAATALVAVEPLVAAGDMIECERRFASGRHADEHDDLAWVVVTVVASRRPDPGAASTREESRGERCACRVVGELEVRCSRSPRNRLDPRRSRQRHDDRRRDAQPRRG